MGNRLGCCTRERGREENGDEYERPVEVGYGVGGASRNSLVDPQTFEFVDALHLSPFSSSSVSASASAAPEQSTNTFDNSNLTVPRRISKRNSLTAWLTGGLFSSSSTSGGGSRGRHPEHGSGGSASTSMREKVKSVKMLMSGAGESGKSTIIKQMKIIHEGGFPEEALYDYRSQIYRNIQESMIQILDAMDPTILMNEERTLECMWIIRRFKPVYDSIDTLPPDYVDAINFLWVEKIRNSLESICRKNYILDSAPYFFDEVNRIAQPGFIPTNEDILRARITTTGINEYRFRSGPLSILMIDVGGQRPERRKWIETFDNVTTLIFCAAISEYDQMLREEPRQNRLLESFQLWESVINSKWFQQSSIVLFLNKKDIFRAKLQRNPLQRYFPEYKPLPEGTSEEIAYEHAADFLKNKFLAMNYGRLQVYPYLTCATDTRNIEMVFAAVRETVLANNLRSAGIL